MNYIFRDFKEGDFLRIRDFLVDSYQVFQRPYNWTIDQWNFSFSLSRVMNGVSAEEWKRKFGIWEGERGDIAAIAHCSGERKGVGCLQLSSLELPNDLLHEMLDYLEREVAIVKKDNLRILHTTFDWDKRVQGILKSRGYKKLKDSFIQEMSVEDRPSSFLPKGFTIIDGNKISDMEKGHAHGKAFGYFDTPYIKRSPVGYEQLRQMPDYRPDLDLYVMSDKGDIVSFCILWYDTKNKIGILEPVGTVPEYRKMGLGRNVIAEAINRIALEGAEKVYVDSVQDFYTAIGFEKKHKINIWEKIIE